MRNPRIFYHAYDHNRPTGGQKHTYQHVDVLNRHGIEAYVVQSAPGFRLTWFENTTAVIDDVRFRSMHDPTRDYVVLPEDLGPRILDYPGRKVIFNKNLYYGCRALLSCEEDPYQSSDVVEVFAVSEHNARHLRYAYPSASVSVVALDIVPERFPLRPLPAKKAQIACSPKAMSHVAVIKQMLRARAEAGYNRTGEFGWVFMEGMTEQQVSAVLNESLVFLFLSVEEGALRFPLEAMAAGCIVVMYANGPLCEFLPEGMGFEYGDLLGIMSLIEKIAEASPDERLAFEPLVERGRKAAEKCSAARQQETVLKAWRRIFAREAHANRRAPARRSHDPAACRALGSIDSSPGAQQPR